MLKNIETVNDEVDYGAALGVEIPTSSEESVSQEPSTEENNGGEKSEVAEQTQVEEQKEEIPNEVWKKARLKAEREAEEKFRNSMADDEYLGATNPYTQKIIRTKQDQQEYLDMHAKEILKNNGLNEQMLQDLINNNPVIKEASELKSQMQMERGQAQIQSEIKKISELNPDIKTFEDIINLPNREKIDDLVINHGYALSDAYKLANFDELVSQKATVAKQQAINMAKGKSHLVPTDGTPSEDVVIPKETLDYYKAFMPELSYKEIKEHYAKSKK